MHTDDTLTADQYRNKTRLAMYLQRLAPRLDPRDHAHRARRGIRALRQIHTLFRALKRDSSHTRPISY